MCLSPWGGLKSGHFRVGVCVPPYRYRHTEQPTAAVTVVLDLVKSRWSSEYPFGGFRDTGRVAEDGPVNSAACPRNPLG